MRSLLIAGLMLLASCSSTYIIVYQRDDHNMPCSYAVWRTMSWRNKTTVTCEDSVSLSARYRLVGGFYDCEYDND